MTTQTAPAYSLLVNSCDAFEDCWGPFFTLLDRYWPDPKPPTLLNTERKICTVPGLEIESSRAQNGRSERLTWSECLAISLDQIRTPLVLYMQEDYFLEQAVDQSRIDMLVKLMLDHPEIAHIGLTQFGAGKPLLKSDFPGLARIGPRASYRISTQAGLWRLPTLKSYVLPWESGWMFELFGTWRSWKRDELFLTVCRDEAGPPIVYQHTGIVKGQWSDFVVPLFAREGVEIDFSRRGFYDASGSGFLRRLKLLRSIASNPRLVLKSLKAS